MPRRKSSRKTRRSSSKSLGTTMRQPLVQVAIVLLVAFIVFIIATAGGGDSQNAGSLPATVSVNEAYQMYTEGTFVLDVRTIEEWNEFHAPNTTLIPLDELPARPGKRTSQGPAHCGRLPLRQPQPDRARHFAGCRVQRHQHDRRPEHLA